MQSQRQHARHAGRGGLARVDVERVIQPAAELAGGVLFHGMDHRIVQLQRIGQGQQRARGGAHPVGQVVQAPVEHIVHASLRQQVGRFAGFTQAGREPAARARAAEALDPVQRGGDGLGLPDAAVLRQRALVDAVADEFPAGLQQRVGGRRIGVDDRGVQAGRGRQASASDGVDHAGQAAAQAVFGPAEIGHVGHVADAVRRGEDGARHGLVERPVFHVDDQVDQDGASVQAGQRRALARHQEGMRGLFMMSVGKSGRRQRPVKTGSRLSAKARRPSA